MAGWLDLQHDRANAHERSRRPRLSIATRSDLPAASGGPAGPHQSRRRAEGSNAINLSWSPTVPARLRNTKSSAASPTRSRAACSPRCWPAPATAKLCGRLQPQRHIHLLLLGRGLTDGTNSAAAGRSRRLSATTRRFSPASAPAPVTGTNVQLTVSATDPPAIGNDDLFWSLLSGPVGADVQLFDGTNLGIQFHRDPAARSRDFHAGRNVCILHDGVRRLRRKHSVTCVTVTVDADAFWI